MQEPARAEAGRGEDTGASGELRGAERRERQPPVIQGSDHTSSSRPPVQLQDRHCILCPELNLDLLQHLVLYQFMLPPMTWASSAIWSLC